MSGAFVNKPTLARPALADRMPIVHTENNGVFATSKDVASFFEKTHHTVLEAIDDLLKIDPSIARNFLVIEVPVKVGFGTRWDRAFKMDRDGFTLLAMGFTGPKALKFKLAYIAAFNEALKRLEEMEKAAPAVVLPDFSNPALAARAWAEQYERAEKASIAAEQERLAAEQAQEVLEGAWPTIAVGEKVEQYRRELVSYARTLTGRSTST